MQPFEVKILGCSSATPTSSRHPTSQIVTFHEKFFLLDCGEATQIQLRRYKIKIQRIDHIFISHLHGDHYLGLPGLLGTMHLLGREKEVHIYSPPGLKEIIDINSYHSKTFFKYKLVYHIISEESARIFENNKLTVDTIPMNHRIPCYGFLFREKPLPRNIITEKINQYFIPLQEIPEIKSGKNFTTNDGVIIPNSELTTAPPTPRSYAYCSDTIFNQSYIQQIQNVDLLYHEATFANDLIDRAKETHHCTTNEAGLIAKNAKVKKLIIGHFSARYNDLDILLNETKKVFENTSLAIEGESFII